MIAKYAYSIDNNYYNVSNPEENMPNDFLEFKEEYTFFFQLFLKYYELCDFSNNIKRKKQMERLLDKLKRNMELLKLPEKFANNIEDWSKVYGVDDFITFMIDTYDYECCRDYGYCTLL
jgi:hypothetical protein